MPPRAALGLPPEPPPPANLCHDCQLPTYTARYRHERLRRAYFWPCCWARCKFFCMFSHICLGSAILSALLFYLAPSFL